jgi:hypothetical protein
VPSPDWSVSLPRRKRRWPLRKKSLLTPTLAHTIRVASVWPPFDRGGSVCLNRFSGLISGVPAVVTKMMDPRSGTA